MNILLQRLSLAHVIISWPHLSQARTVFLFDPYITAPVKPENLQTRLARWLLGKIKNTRVIQVDREIRNRLAYLNNYDSDKYVERVMKHVRNMASYRIMWQTVGNKEVDRIYCRLLFPYISKTSQFYRMAESFLKKQGSLTLIPVDDDPWKIQKYFDTNGISVPPQVLIFNFILGVIKRRFISLFLNGIYLPAVFIFHIIKWFPRKSTQFGLKVPVIIPILSGFPGKDGLLDSSFGKIKTESNDTSLIGEKLNSNNIAFYYSHWKFNEERRIKQKQWMANHGIQWFDPANFSTNKAHRLEVWNLSKGMLKSLFWNPNILIEPPQIVRISAHVLYHFLTELHFNHSIDYLVRVEYTDYSPENVMRTIVANRFGRNSIGVHHSANSLTHVFPELRYMYMNRLCLWNEEFRKAYGPSWNSIECVPIGNHRLDYVLAALSPNRLRELRNIVKLQWRISGYVLLITLPNHPKDVIYQNPKRFPKLYEGILNCLEAIPELWVVFRARSPKGWQDYLHFESLVRKLDAHPRVISDFEKLSTFEWIALADVVVGNSTSSVIVEAGTAGKKCFSFDTEGRAELTFGKYGKDFVLTESNHLVHAIKGALYGTPHLDCDWKQFAHDMTYFADGKNIKRFQDAIWDLVLRTQNNQKSTLYDKEKRC